LATTLDQSIHEAAAAICLELGVAPIAVNGGLLKAWILQEKGNTSGAAWDNNNPLNTTEPVYPDANINSDGVKRYDSQQEGVFACCKTLRDGNYPHLLAGLQDANAEEFFAQPTELNSPGGWGTGWQPVYDLYQEILSGELV
jgi:hypothetical protein